MNTPEAVLTDVIVRDIRFPTSRELDGSDAMNVDPDYSVAYVVVKTSDAAGPEGHGFTFTQGRGTEVCVAMIEALAPIVVGLRDLLSTGTETQRKAFLQNSPYALRGTALAEIMEQCCRCLKTETSSEMRTLPIRVISS